MCREYFAKLSFRRLIALIHPVILTVCFFALTPLLVQSNEVAIVRYDAKGAGTFIDIAEIGNRHYFRSFLSRYVQITDSTITNADNVIGHLTFSDHVTGIANWNGHLVVSYANKIEVLDVQSGENSILFADELPFGGYREVSIATTQDKLVFTDDQGYVAIYGQLDGSISKLSDTTVIRETDDNPSSIPQITAAINQDTVYLAYVKRFSNQPQEMQVVIETWNTTNGTLERSQQFEFDTRDNTFNYLVYLSENRFAFNGEGGQVYIFGIDQNGFNLIETLTDGQELTATGLAYFEEELWVVFNENIVRSYDLTSLPIQSSRQSSIQTLRTENLFPWFLKATSSGIYGASAYEFYKISSADAQIEFESPYSDSGLREPPVYLEGNIFQPIGNRVHQYRITSENTLALTNVYDTRPFMTSVKLHVNGDNIFAFQGAKSILHFKLVEGQLTEIDSRFTNDFTLSYFADQSALHFAQSNGITSTIDLGAPFPLSSIATRIHQYENPSLEKSGVVQGHKFAVDASDRLSLVRFELEENEFVIKSSKAIDGIILDVAYTNDLIYVQGFAGLNIFRVDEDGSLEQIDHPTHRANASYVESIDDILFIGTEFDIGTTMLIYDLSDSQSPVLLAESFNTGFLGVPESIINAGDYYIIGSGQRDPFGLYQLNYRPRLAESIFQIQEDSTLELMASELDPEQDELVIEVLSEPTNGVLEFNSDSQLLTYTPDADYFGDDSASLKLVDTHGNQFEGDMLLNVNAVNDVPQVTDQLVVIEEDTYYEGDLAIVDPDDNTFTITIIEEAESGLLEVTASGMFNYQPRAGFNGKDIFTVSVTDSQRANAQVSLEFRVTAVNDVPTLTETNFSITEDQRAEIELPVYDEDGDRVVVNVISFDDKLSEVSIDKNILTITPGEDQFGDASIVLKLSDNVGAEQDMTINIVIEGVDDAPDAEGLNLSLSENGNQSGQLPIIDRDGESLTYEITEDVKNGTLQLNLDGSFTYTPNSGFIGQDDFTFLVSDTAGNTVTGEVNLTINALPTQPSSGSNNQSGSGGGGNGLGFLIALMFVLGFRLVPFGWEQPMWVIR